MQDFPVFDILQSHGPVEALVDETFQGASYHRMHISVPKTPIHLILLFSAYKVILLDKRDIQYGRLFYKKSRMIVESTL